MELEPAIIWKVAACQRITSKNNRTQWVDTRARDTVRRYWSAETLFWQLSISQNMDVYNIRLQAPKLAGKCEIKHWYACGADGRKVGWSMYGHVIAEFSKLWIEKWARDTVRW